MSAFHHTPSPNDMATTKVKDPQQCTKEDWTLVSEAKLDPVSSNDKVQRDECRWKQDEEQREAEERRACKEVAKKAWEEAERQAEEVCRAQEEAEKKEREEREAATQKAQEAAEAQADAEQRALEKRLWDAAVQCLDMAVAPSWVAKPGGRMASGVQDPCTQCCNKGTLCILDAAKGKTMACEACHHVKVSCSWMKRMVGEAWKKKQVHCSEEVDDIEMVEASEDNEEEETWLHFAVLPHLVEEH
ncbi:hypothetical protein ID866_11782 [Astraeus odoratus]|nr:hypothetical protein ID866_11782 [Astraeus odoratus]